jgi:putative transposase
VLDLFTRECLDIVVGRGLTGQDVVAALERLRFDRGLPKRIYCDNGTEFVSAASRTAMRSSTFQYPAM